MGGVVLPSGPIAELEVKPGDGCWLLDGYTPRGLRFRYWWRGRPTNKFMLRAIAGGAPLDLQVGASSDDAYQSSADVVTLTDISWTVDSTTQHGGNRFVATIPAGATITLAQFGIYISGTTNDEPQHQLRGQAAAAPLTFTTASNNIDSRIRTTATHQWNSTNLGAAAGELWEWGATVAGAGNGINIGSIIQENVDAFGELTALVFIYEQHTLDAARDLGQRAYDYSPPYPARLHIEYTAGGAAVRRMAVIG